MRAALKERPALHTFDNDIVLSPHCDGRHWRIREHLHVFVEYNSRRRHFCIPRDFVTDLTSVPRMIWWLYPSWGRYGRAAVLHDFLYSGTDYSRIHCDRIFYQLMREYRVSLCNALVLYTAVRCFGWLSWKRKQRGSRLIPKLSETDRSVGEP